MFQQQQAELYKKSRERQALPAAARTEYTSDVDEEDKDSNEAGRENRDDSTKRWLTVVSSEETLDSLTKAVINKIKFVLFISPCQYFPSLRQQPVKVLIK